MAAPHVHLQFQFADAPQADGVLDHPLLAMLAAVQAAGSIQRAAAALGVSYRHLWGALKRWEGQLGQPLVLWTQGHPARLTPAALRLLTGTRLACARQAAQIDALRAAMDQALATALGTAPPALAIVASPEPVLALLRRRLQTAGLLHLQLQADTSWGALRALAEGRCAVAAVHRPPPGTPFDAGLAALLAGGAHRVLLRVQRRQGLMLAPGNPLLLEVPAALARPGCGWSAARRVRAPGRCWSNGWPAPRWRLWPRSPATTRRPPPWPAVSATPRPAPKPRRWPPACTSCRCCTTTGCCWPPVPHCTSPPCRSCSSSCRRRRGTRPWPRCPGTGLFQIETPGPAPAGACGYSPLPLTRTASVSARGGAASK